MRILGIESSCDETAVAVVEDGKRLLSNVTHSQIDIQAEYGGVVPEIAARSHIEAINPVIKRALSDANCTWADIDAIAVTYAPGLVGSLLVGNLAARTLAVIHQKPLYKIHHIEAHVYANFITEQINLSREGEPPDISVTSGKLINYRADLKLPSRQPKFPILALIVSGNHSQLAVFRDHGDFRLLGQTQDDAIGEAFDKVAKIIGLPYPGGPAISKVAEQGNPKAFELPIAKLSGKYDFSFSGLKTAVLRLVQREVGVDFRFPSHQLPELVSEVLRRDVAASFQHTAVKAVVTKTKQAYDEYQPASVVIAGGVAANNELRRQLTEAIPINIEYAPIQLCTDNGAMVACLGYYRSQVDQQDDPFSLEVLPSLSMLSGSRQNQEIL